MESQLYVMAEYSSCW